MIDKPSVDVYRALIRLEGNADFHAVTQYLKKEQEKLTINLKESSELNYIFNLQGACRVVDSLIETVNEARKVVRNSKLSKRNLS